MKGHTPVSERPSSECAHPCNFQKLPGLSVLALMVVCKHKSVNNAQHNDPMQDTETNGMCGEVVQEKFVTQPIACAHQ